MACVIRVNRHGYLAYRLRWNGVESHEGTGLRDTPANRVKLEARARVMSDEVEAGTFQYLRWFPQGNKAHLFQPKRPSLEITVREYAEQKWLPRMQPPNARASTARTYRKHVARHILPAFGELHLTDVTPAALEDFRALLTRSESEGGKGLKMKTARDIIDGTFRALYRAARTVDRLVTDDPFAALRWPRKIELEPDPFTADERDRLLNYFRERDPWYFPLVYLLFWTGLRVGEVVGLRCGDVGLREGKLSVRRSRTLGEDNPPKTARSVRTIPLRPEVVGVLRAMPTPLHRTDESFFFTNQTGRPLDEERFVEKHWHRALRATGIRPRKFYATRHTFMSLTLMAGKVKIKRLADYCGTSVAMIEKHYARWMAEDTPEEIGGLGGLVSPVLDASTPVVAVVGDEPDPSPGGGSGRRPRAGTLAGTFRADSRRQPQVARKISDAKAEGGRFELPRALGPGGFQDRCLKPGSATPPDDGA